MPTVLESITASVFELAGKNWTGFGLGLRCGIAPRMVENQGDRNGEHTKAAQRGV
jgi:hypothetical protein